VQDEWWGWARKAPGEPRRYSVESSRPLGCADHRGAAQGDSTRRATGHANAHELIAESAPRALAAAVLVLAGCGGGDEAPQSQQQEQAGSTEGAKAAPSLEEARDATGSVTV
jgi:hypothetical protein